MLFTTRDITIRAGSSPSASAKRQLVLPYALPLIHIAEYCLNFCTAVVIFALVESRLALRYPAIPHTSIRNLLALDILLGAIVLVMLTQAGAYRASSGLLRVRETACVLRASVLSVLVIAPSALLIDIHLAMGFLIFAFPPLALLLVIEKHIAHTLFDAYRKRGVGLKRVLIYGSGAVGRRLYATLGRSPRLGLQPIALVDTDAQSHQVSTHDVDGVPVTIAVDSCHSFSASLLRSYQADIVLIASAELSRTQMRNVLEETAAADASVIFAADLASEYTHRTNFTDLDGELLFGPGTSFPPLLNRQVSRVIDIIVSSVVLMSISPLLSLLGLLIKAESKGPMLFRQTRIGKDGIPFTIFKFRTMHHEHCGDQVSPKSSRDLRITQVGRWLRKASLDEVPQLLNILRGEMSLVGPRPEMPFIVAAYTAEQRKRLTVRPGLTGLWQISADRNLPIHENIHYDLYYLRNQSLYMDFAIIFHTIVFAMKGI